MEDCVERFKYILQSLGHSDLDKYILNIILLWALKEDSLQILNILGKGDISKEEFDTIYEFCIQCSRGAARSRQGIRSLKTSGGGVTKAEIGKLLDNLRTDILSTLSAQMDTLQAKKKQMELEKTMAIFCPQCRKKHSLKECSLNTVELCTIYEQTHATSSCPSLPRLTLPCQD